MVNIRLQYDSVTQLFLLSRNNVQCKCQLYRKLGKGIMVTKVEEGTGLSKLVGRRQSSPYLGKAAAIARSIQPPTSITDLR